MCSDGNFLCPGENQCPETDNHFPRLGDVKVYINGKRAEYQVTSAVLLPGTSTWRFTLASSGKLFFITSEGGMVRVLAR